VSRIGLGETDSRDTDRQ